MMSVIPDKEGAETPQSGSVGAGYDADSDEVLAYDAGSGDIRAFESLVTRYEKFVYKSAYYVTGNPEDTADLVQEIFLGLWRGLPSYRRDAKFFTYLARITRNACADWIRKRKKAPGTVPIIGKEGDDDVPEAVLPAAPEETSPELVTEQNERKQVLHRAIAALSEEHRTVIVLRDMEGYSYDRIAGLLGVDEGTVKSRLFRARRRLKTILEKQGFFP